jgi:hypothetical protein
MQASRTQLINWLTWNDPNGCYTDEANMLEFDRKLSTDELLNLVLTQITEGAA